MEENKGGRMTREEAKLLLIRPTVSSNVISETKAREIEAYNMAVDALSERTGEWVMKEHLWECDQCGCRINRANPLKGNIWNYYFCPNCGADMRNEVM